MNSELEKLAALLSRRSPGAPFLFTPDEYRNGRTTGRPCDLVWACSGCVILFAACDSARPREKMARHNFNHLKAWYREWHAGRRIRGRNAMSSFDIAFDQYPHRVLVSVVKGAEATAEIHPEIEAELAASGLPRPTRCATISQNVIEYLAENAGGVPDLLQFVDDLGGKAPLSADEALRAIRRRHNASFNFVMSEPYRDEFRGDPRLYTQDPIYAALQCGPMRTGDILAASLLGDLSWPQMVRLVCHARHLERKAESLPPDMFGVRSARAVLDFPPYLFGLIVSRSGGEEPGLQRAGEPIGLLQSDICRHERFQERFSVLLCLHRGEKGQRSFSAVVVPAPDESGAPLRSQTTALLDAMASRTPAPG
jgi:hypothetical protein